jgi:hypothetical protein
MFEDGRKGVLTARITIRDVVSAAGAAGALDRAA